VRLRPYPLAKALSPRPALPLLPPLSTTRSVPELIRGWIRQVPRRTCALLWLGGAVSEGSRVANSCHDQREEATSGARALPPTVECTADSVKRRGGSSR